MGVDPGISGGFAVLNGDGKILHVQSFKGSMTEQELVDSTKIGVKILRANWPHICFMEKVGYIKGDGGKGAFTFGNVNALIKGALYAQGVDIRFVYPMVWQGRMDCLTGGNKNISKDMAKALFADQGVKITHTNADALLIAEYGRRSLLSAAQTRGQFGRVYGRPTHKQNAGPPEEPGISDL